MKKILFLGMSFLVLTMFFGCKPEDDPVEPEQPTAHTLISTIETTHSYGFSELESNTYVEAIYSDSTRMYFRLLSDSTAEVVNFHDFYRPEQFSEGWSYRGDVEIPESFVHLGNTFSVVKIGESAFGEGIWDWYDGWGLYLASSVTSVKMPNTVTSISYMSFACCKDLTSVEMSNAITEIPASAFACCERLETINLPNTIQSIASHAFEGCSAMTEFVIPKWVTELGMFVFGVDTTPLKTLTCLPLEPPVKAVWDSYGDDFFLPESIETIYVPAISVNAYKSSLYWAPYASKIVGMNQ